MKKLTKITYRAYQQEPYAPDAIGYVDGRYLRDADDEQFVYWDKDGQTVARSGYIFVYGDDFYAVIKKRHNVSSRMTAKAPWTADEMYLIMGEINWPPERMHELFPPRAKQKAIRSRKP